MRYARVCDRNQHRARALCYPHPHTAATTSWSISRANAGPCPVPSPSGVLHQAIRGMRRLIKGAAERAKPCDNDDNASSRAGIPARRRAGAAAVLPASAPQRAGKAEARHSAVGATVHCWSIASWLLPSPFSSLCGGEGYGRRTAEVTEDTDFTTETQRHRGTQRRPPVRWGVATRRAGAHRPAAQADPIEPHPLRVSVTLRLCG